MAAMAAGSSKMIQHHFLSLDLASVLLVTSLANAININILDSIPAGRVTVSCSLNGRGQGSHDLISGRRYNIQFQDVYAKPEMVACWFHKNVGQSPGMQVKLWDVSFGGGPAPCQYCQWSLRSDGLYFQSSLYKKWP